VTKYLRKQFKGESFILAHGFLTEKIALIISLILASGRKIQARRKGYSKNNSKGKEYTFNRLKGGCL
jgi:hypothetical protein